MPLIDVTYGPRVTDATLTRLAASLPTAVSLAVECPEEPYDGELRPGDVELRFKALGPHDSSGLDICIEIRSKWFASRAQNRQDRCDSIRREAETIAGQLDLGVYLSLPDAAWSQSD